MSHVTRRAIEPAFGGRLAAGCNVVVLVFLVFLVVENVGGQA